MECKHLLEGNTYLKADGGWQRRRRRLEVMSESQEVMSETHHGPTPRTRRIATTRRAGQGAGLALPQTSSHLCLSAGVCGWLRVRALGCLGWAGSFLGHNTALSVWLAWPQRRVKIGRKRLGTTGLEATSHLHDLASRPV